MMDGAWIRTRRGRGGDYSLTFVVRLDIIGPRQLSLVSGTAAGRTLCAECGGRKARIRRVLRRAGGLILHTEADATTETASGEEPKPEALNASSKPLKPY